MPHPALIVVDLQRYYLDPEANFRKYPESIDPGAFDYVTERCRETVVPNVTRLLAHFRERSWPVIFLRLCGQNPDRSDLHRLFKAETDRAAEAGFPGIYPLADDPLADVIPEAAPLPGDTVLDKVTFSAFTSSEIGEVLVEKDADVLVFCGLATSQCVDTTARDASDHGFEVIHVEDAQADYSKYSHQASLFASQGVCGGCVVSTAELLDAERPSDLLPW